MVGFPADGGVPVPFPAVVGQERLKRALLAVSVNEAIDGLLIRGEKGTAKSTAVRGLVDLLPEQQVVADCPYGCPPDAPERQCEQCRAREDPPVETRPVPLVTVPLGATRERIVGSLSVSDAMDGEVSFEPGLLARANRGFLYVDEVNLLDDHLVDVLLDAAASGVNRVERDGMSVTHPADFTLLGTMNPEEGDLRPQLRDRFAIQATVRGSADPEERVAIIDTALEHDQDGGARSSDVEQAVEARRQTVTEARDRLPEVDLPTEFKETIAEVCRDAGVDGHRGDIASARTALALAALDNRTQVIQSDIREALEFALPHRLQSRPFEESTDLQDVLDDQFEDEPDTPDGESDPDSDQDETPSTEESADSPDDGGREDEGKGEGGDHGPEQSPTDQQSGDDAADGDESPASGPADSTPEHDGGSDGGSHSDPSNSRPAPEAGNGGAGSDSEPGMDAAQEPGETAGDPDGGDESAADPTEVSPAKQAHRPAPVGDSAAPPMEIEEESKDVLSGSKTAGRVRTEPSADAIGPRIRTEPADSSETVDAAASIREAAKNGRNSVDSRDLRQSVRAGTASALVVFAVDASASMRPAIEAAKGTVMELLKDAYQERDEVAFVAFAGEDAEVLLPPTDSVTLAARHLKELPTGDRTPLPAGLDVVRDVIDRADPAASVAVVVTDGRTNVAAESPTAETRSAARSLGDVADSVLVVDAGDPEDSIGLIDDIVAETDGRAIQLATLSADSVTDAKDRAWE